MIAVCVYWLRGVDLNHRPSAYEAAKLPLLYPAIYLKKKGQFFDRHTPGLQKGNENGRTNPMVTPPGFEPGFPA